MLSSCKAWKEEGMIVSLKFIVFLITVLGCYYVIPGKGKQFLLLIANMAFYGALGIQNMLILCLMILFSYYGAVWLECNKDKRLLTACIILSILPLIILKYCKITSFIEPIGISFFTFKVICYLVDTYQDRIKTKHSLLDYSIYVSFFPTITSGPIDRAEAFIKQMKVQKYFEERRFVEGLLLVLWGYFQKMVIADRLAIVVGAVFDQYQNYTGFPLFAASILYTMQIYFDFAGYTHIALGIALGFGYECQPNFCQPYFSRSIREFWQRWHISLSGWLRDYIYIPLGGNRKGNARKYMNLMITFLVSGIWHGAGWNFVAWGALHGCFQVIGALTERTRIRIKEKLHIRDTIIEHGIQILITFLLVNFAWVLFRGNGGMMYSLDILRRMFLPGEIGFSWLWGTGVVKIECVILLAALLIAVVIDIIRYWGKDVQEIYFKSPVIVRFVCLYILFFTIIIFGVYGPGYDASSFIYFNF